MGNVDRFRAIRDGDYFEGVSVRLFDVARDEWSIHWVDTRTGAFSPPVRGRFDGARGEFYGEELLRGSPVRVRWIWTREDAASAARSRPTQRTEEVSGR